MFIVNFTQNLYMISNDQLHIGSQKSGRESHIALEEVKKQPPRFVFVNNFYVVHWTRILNIVSV